MNNVNQLLLVVPVLCTGCMEAGYMEAVLKERELVIKERMVVLETSGCHNGGMLFFAEMLPDDAKNIGAPHSAVYKEMVEKAVLAREKKLGKLLCSNGYAWTGLEPKVVYGGLWTTGYYCLPEPSAKVGQCNGAR